MTRETAAGLDAFYPIAPDVHWLRRLVPLGVRTIQLRLKDAAPDEVKRQIAESIKITRQHACQLIVNDYWAEAIALGADYVHLGQEDLAVADIAAIRAAGLRIGISTHDHSELETALRIEPDYVALGPIYETKLKVMKWAPQGLDRITDWRNRIGDVALVAIGGLTPERATLAQKHGADSIAVITDFVTHPDPEYRVREWLNWSQQPRPVLSSN